MKKINNIGRKIKMMRNLKNTPQRYMAKELGITQGAYSNIEKTENEISDERISKIAQIMEVTVDEIEKVEEKITLNITNNDQKGGSNGYVTNNYSTNEQDEILLKISDNLLKTVELLNYFILQSKK